jgi:hypothetical protein
MPLTAGSTYEFRLFSFNSQVQIGSAAGPVTVTAPPSPTVSAAPSTVAPGTSTTVSWANIATPHASDWIGLYHDSSAADTAFISWVYVSCSHTQGSSGIAAGSCGMQMPNAPGSTYEFRLFTNGGFTRLATSGPVTDTPTISSLTVPASVKAGQPFQVSWSGINPASATDWMGLYQPGAPDAGGFVAWQYLSSCSTTAGSAAQASGTCTFTAPATTGTYEVRVFAANGFTHIAVQQVSVVP